MSFSIDDIKNINLPETNNNWFDFITINIFHSVIVESFKIIQLYT